MSDPKQHDAVTRVAEQPTAVEQLTEAELEWCRLAGFTRREWQRLLFARWLYRTGELTEYPEGR
jgi:hypothetical protein